MPRDVRRKGQDAPSPLSRKVGMAAKVRSAIALIVSEGLTQRQAAGRVGMNERSLSRALKRPAVAQHLEEQKALFLQEVDALKGQAKRIAIMEGLRLMRESPSDQVRARMVEFFAGEAGKAPLVNVNIGAKSSGYEYIPPGSQVIDITPTDNEAAGQGEEGEK
jgi:predicted DNA-binding protein (UPF0251 family)